ncbi:MAG TPA: helix-hairpin-helix domain-containing protein, partial [Pedobacter sp.]
MPSLYEIALTLIPGVGAVTARSLLEYFGDPETVFKASHSRLISVSGIGNKTAAGILSKDALVRAE